MKRRLKLRALLWSLVWILGTISFVACSNDNESPTVYNGYIQRIYKEEGYFVIKVTKTPDSIEERTPHVNDEIHVELADFPSCTFYENQKITFRVLSTKGLFSTANLYYSLWACKIEIINLK